MASNIIFKKPSKKSVMPHWAMETVEKEEVASVLLQAIQNNRRECGEILDLYFGNDEKIIVEILSENELQPDFVYSHMNNDFGKGVILGLLMFFLKEKMEEKEAENGPGNEEEGEDEFGY